MSESVTQSEEPVEAEEPEDGPEYLGNEVMHARVHKGLTQGELASQTGFERTYVTRVEGGKRLSSERFAEACDRVFNTPGSFARLRHRVSERGHPGWFVPYLKLEREASGISDYSNAFVMGMLQTSEYAEAAFRSTHPREDDDQIKSRVEARLRRHDVMEREAPPLLWVILHESVLRTVVGSRAVMVGQLERLAAEAATPHVTVQVLPFSAGAPASSLPFTLITQDDEAPVLYSETREKGHVNDSAGAVASATATYERLRAAALSAEASLDLFRKITTEDHAR
ncbi:helix-turn-helix domain-containing protein [Streptomyces sp. H27-D2]|uniref:helix-turn-helix domain-containing protein n=1 Tax=Streptomyces sp. H27-D2 TaxID=3046304 RepID=UPI002DB66FE3|nr:helix-turn-helix transcriptional regulator [Streptomyces sp. H27-D2]MEC4018459.1 helix-turn-helix transcriptional regulator [Streptomyces sp. H27-D2]